MKAMQVVVSLGECCFPSSRTLPLSASPRLPSLRHHAPLGSPQAPRPPGAFMCTLATAIAAFDSLESDAKDSNIRQAMVWLLGENAT